MFSRGEDVVQRADEVAGGIDQRAIEIEDEKGGKGHAPDYRAAIGRARRSV